MNNRRFNGTDLQKSNYFIIFIQFNYAGSKYCEWNSNSNCWGWSSCCSDIICLLPDLGTVQSPSSLSDEQKYQILSTIPAKLQEYPVNSQKQCYQSYWTEQFPLVRYSASLHGVFCGPCFLFSQVRFNSECVASPFHNWKNAVGTVHGTLNRHSQSQSHKQCVEQAVSFIAVMEKNKHPIK